MRSALVRRTVLTASAVSLTLLATACGSDKASDTKTDGKASAPAAPAAKGKTAAELAPLLVTQADLPTHKIEPVEEEKTAAVDSDKAECKVLAQAQSMQPLAPSTGVGRIMTVELPKPAAEGASVDEKMEAAMGALKSTATSVTLSSYDGKGAEDAFASVKTAVTACAGGFAVTQKGEQSTPIGNVTSEPATSGDEAVGFSSVMDMGDGQKKKKMHTVVVRKGNVLATFWALNLAGDSEQPKAVVDAQVKKLG
ncbi:hypothetical protein [Streptomyces sp. NPDC060333]|uniref:hypothetical protein n=1 Tax=Streptomyces sp. NPDC060333 TaxID=3347098 RepID=UPI00364AAB28